MPVMRVFAVSDLHVDHLDNRQWVEGLSRTEYRNDALIVAGDLSHRAPRLESALTALRERFASVFFVPGNHDAWLVGGEPDSWTKIRRILERCASLDVSTDPRRLGDDEQAVWIVPLLSWYVKPEEGADSLYGPKPGESGTLEGWADEQFVRWPDFPEGTTPASALLGMNHPAVERAYDAPVISFSHFLPRRELIFSGRKAGRVHDSHVWFNFSRVAGSKGIERQIRRLGPRVHVYGHQHRNRRRRIEDILYVSHCLGYGRERENGQIHHFDGTPLCVWRDGEVAVEAIDEVS